MGGGGTWKEGHSSPLHKYFQWSELSFSSPELGTGDCFLLENCQVNEPVEPLMILEQGESGERWWNIEKGTGKAACIATQHFLQVQPEGGQACRLV